MKSVILCEGADDMWIMAYYLHKKYEWKQVDIDNISEKAFWMGFVVFNKGSSNSDGTLSNKKKRMTQIFMRKDHDVLVITAVGGKDAFKKPLNAYFNIIPEDAPLSAADNIIIMSDRDNDEIAERLAEIENWMDNNWNKKHAPLENKIKCTAEKHIDGTDICINILPIVIPFNERGAVETLLMNGLAELNEENRYIVDEAKKYIEDIKNSGNITTYLKKERLLLKAKYSAMIAVMNPDHSTHEFGKMMMSGGWEDSEYIDEHFSLIAHNIS